MISIYSVLGTVIVYTCVIERHLYIHFPSKLANHKWTSDLMASSALSLSPNANLDDFRDLCLLLDTRQSLCTA